MAKPILTYFDFDGGRGEPVRLAFHLTGIEFEDERISFQQFGERQGSYPFRAIPTLKMGDTTLSQSNAMLRYIGSQGDLWPQDPEKAMACDEILGALEDASHKYGNTFGLKGDAFVKARENFTENTLRPYLSSIEQRLSRFDGPYLCGEQLTVADLKLFGWTRFLKSGAADHVPTDIAEQCAPAVVAHREHVASHPKIQAYYANR